MRQAKGLGDRFFMLRRTFKTICQLSITIIAMLRKKREKLATGQTANDLYHRRVELEIVSFEQHFLNV